MSTTSPSATRSVNVPSSRVSPPAVDPRTCSCADAIGALLPSSTTVPVICRVPPCAAAVPANRATPANAANNSRRMCPLWGRVTIEEASDLE